MEKNPHPECQLRRNDLDNAITAFVDRYPQASFSSVLQSHQPEFDNQQIRASLRRLQRGGRIEIERWVAPRPWDPSKSVSMHGFSLKKAA